MKAYIASRFVNALEVKKVSDKLAKIGIECIQTWPSEELGKVSKHVAAQRDIDELDMVDLVIVYTKDCEKVPGGMHFEAGYAYGNAKDIVVIGPKVNIFYDMPDVEHYESLELFMEARIK